MPTREEMRSVGSDIVRSYEDRVASIAQLRETVKADLNEARTQLQELGAAHAAMSKELKAELSKERKALAHGEKKRQAEAREFMGELAGVVAEGKDAVKARLGEFDSAHNAMSTAMRAELSRERKDLAQGEKKRQGEVRKFMADLARAHGGGHDEWRKVTATMQAKRAGPTVETKRPAARKAASPPPGEE